MSQHTPNAPDDDVPQYAIYTFPASSFQVSDLIQNPKPGLPRGSRVLRLDVVIPPGMLNEKKISGLMLPTGQMTNPLAGNVPVPPTIQLTLKVEALSPEAKRQIAEAEDNPDIEGELEGGLERDVGSRLPGMLGDMLDKRQ